MSHRASSWLATIPATQINASSFRVLFHLCDAHNSMRPPEEACFPQQAALLSATGLSNGGLNNALNAIEEAGLMRRLRTTDSEGRRRTYYILGCDFDRLTDQTPKIGVRPNSNLEGTKLQSEGGANSNSVEFDTNAEPVKEPVIEPVKGDGLFSDLPKADQVDHFPAFWAAYPKCQRKVDRPKAMALFQRIVTGKHGVIAKTAPEVIIEGLRRYASTNPDPAYIPLPTTWLNGERWTQFQTEAQAEDPEVAAYRARMRRIIEEAEAAKRGGRA